MTNAVPLESIENDLLVIGTGSSAQDFIEYYALSRDKTLVTCTHRVSRAPRGFKFVPFNDIPENKKYNIVIASQFFYEIYQKVLSSSIQYHAIYHFNNTKYTIHTVESLIRNENRDRILYAFYDLEQNPASFDACVFANAAEHWRRKKKLDAVHFVVVAPVLKYGRLCDANFYENGSITAYQERIEYLLTPIFSLIPARCGISFLPCREETTYFTKNQHIFPENYHHQHPQDTHNPMTLFDLPQPIGYFRSPRRAAHFVADKLRQCSGEDRKTMTLTLREYVDAPSRNNNLAAWARFLPRLKKQGFNLVIVRDSCHAGRSALGGFEDYIHFPEASIDIGVRMALYEQAHCNFFCNNGVVLLAAFSAKANYIVFNLLDENRRCTNRDYFKHRFGLKYGAKNYLWSSHENQRLVWEYDTYECITREVERFGLKL